MPTITLIKIITKITVQTIDDIVKAHGGQIKLRSNKGEGAGLSFSYH